MVARKISNSKSGLQGRSWSPAIVQFHRNTRFYSATLC